MKRTTIFLSDDLHEQLRQAAFRKKVSMAELIRSRLQRVDRHTPRRNSAPDPIMKVAGICRGPLLSNNIDESLYGG